jgi:bifunctional UDP-N-acetylglucosamine pyrophosphorylase/glucosamine-1-phosphate N-acetyltransferase
VLTPFDNVQGVNTLEELWRLEKIKRNELIRSWMARGVRFENPENTRVDVDVTIGKNSIIGSGVLILRGTHVGEGSMIGAFSILGNAIIGSESTIRSHTVIQDSIIGEKCILGPFVRVRGNSVIHNEAHVESFADITRSTLLPHAHVPQLSAVVDTKIDKDSYQANIFVKQEKPNLSTPQQHS